MKRLRLRLPSPAMVVALMALFASLGGVSYAVATGSIDSREIADNTIRAQDIRSSAVTASEIRRRSLDGTDIKIERVGGNAVKEQVLESEKIKEVPLATNAEQLGGTPAAAHLRNSQIVDPPTVVALSSTSAQTDSVACPEGKKALGGGGILYSETNDVALQESGPSANGNGWVVKAAETDDTADLWDVQATVVCSD